MGEGSKSEGTSSFEAISSDELRELLNVLELEGGEESNSYLFLPALEGNIVPSSLGRFHGDDVESSRPLPLVHQQVPAIALSPLDTISLLSSLPQELPQGWRYSDSLLYWLEGTKFLLELLAHGRFVPVIQRNVETFRSRWRLALTGKEYPVRFATLVDAAPLGSYASASNVRADADSYAALESFLQECGDALIRHFLRRSELAQQTESTAYSAKIRAGSAFLRSLTVDSPIVHGPVAEVVKLETRLQQWAAPVLGKRKRSELRVSFKVIEPERRDQTIRWKVDFLLHTEADPRHTVTAAEIYGGQLGFLRHADITIGEVEEVLLEELGRAAQIFPLLKKSLREFCPTSLELSTTEVYQLLREESSLLEEAGIKVIVPDWWHTAASRLGLRLRMHGGDGQSRLPAGLGMNTLVEYSWQISIGEKTLTSEEFNDLLRSPEPLAFIDGRWVELSPQRLERTRDFLQRHQPGESLPLGQLLRLSAGLQEEEDLLPIVGSDASGWLSELLEREKPFDSLVQQPDDFKGELRRYQLEGLSWLVFLSNVGLGGCLADDMGLGKTIQLLALLLLERQNRAADAPPVRPTLLVVPMSILGTWMVEARRFSPTLRANVHHGPFRLTGSAFTKMVSESDLVLTTYSIVHRDEEAMSNISWGRIALDEAQNIKNLNTKQTRAVRRVTFRQLSDILPGGQCQRVALTGTPLENHLEELWSIFDFLNPGYLGELPEFRRRFTVPIEKYRDEQSSKLLAHLIRPLLLRRVKSDPKVISDLPEKMEMDELISLTPEQAALYQKSLDEMLNQVDSATGMHRKGLVLATITRLKQICNHPALFAHEEKLAQGDLRSGKLRRLEELLDVILDEGDKVLIFSQFAQLGSLLKPYLEERFRREVLFLHGGLSRGAREKVVDRFQMKDGPSIFLLSLKVGGYGLNLTEANQVIHFDQWWNPAVQDQATDRAYRIGQKRNVQVRRFLCSGTLEERIAELLNRKRSLSREIVGTTRNLLTEMSTDELRELLQLSADSSQFLAPEQEEEME
ncbi:MAG: DEAD/DEAH box helicase [Deltaproteobacteria bacterium]|nr:DEAD/DEAH box helicase [Deltaproteobacteria bacterium]